MLIVLTPAPADPQLRHQRSKHSANDRLDGTDFFQKPSPWSGFPGHVGERCGHCREARIGFARRNFPARQMARARIGGAAMAARELRAVGADIVFVGRSMDPPNIFMHDNSGNRGKSVGQPDLWE
jgi:hypothetical protein